MCTFYIFSDSCYWILNDILIVFAEKLTRFNFVFCDAYPFVVFRLY